MKKENTESSNDSKDKKEVPDSKKEWSVFSSIEKEEASINQQRSIINRNKVKDY